MLIKRLGLPRGCLLLIASVLLVSGCSGSKSSSGVSVSRSSTSCYQSFVDINPPLLAAYRAQASQNKSQFGMSQYQSSGANPSYAWPEGCPMPTRAKTGPCKKLCSPFDVHTIFETVKYPHPFSMVFEAQGRDTIAYLFLNGKVDAADPPTVYGEKPTRWEQKNGVMLLAYVFKDYSLATGETVVVHIPSGCDVPVTAVSSQVAGIQAG